MRLIRCRSVFAAGCTGDDGPARAVSCEVFVCNAVVQAILDLHHRYDAEIHEVGEVSRIDPTESLGDVPGRGRRRAMDLTAEFEVRGGRSSGS
jgi:hypothetical protein